MTEILQLHSDVQSWLRCKFCEDFSSKSSKQFLRHLRELHCIQEGGSFVCKYGQNNVCSSLPLEGVSDKDYEEHVVKHHVRTMQSRNSSDGSKKFNSNDGAAQWGVYSSTQNIPAVLNDPRKGMKRDFFTRTWGETFIELREVPTHVALPDVSERHFESYLRKLKKRQRLLSKVAIKEAVRQEEDLEVSGNSPASPGHLLNHQAAIPSIFLSSSFSLEDPSTFYSVFTHITSSGVSKRNAKGLQDKLFHFLEAVESDMCRQIARKSSAFFDTMTYLNAQMEQLQLNYNAASTLRNGVSKLRKEVVYEPMRILSLPRRRANVMSASKKMEVMSAVREVQSTIQVMLARQEYSASLDLIAATQDLLQSELSSIKSLRNLGSELTEHEKLIDKMVSAEFAKYVTEDLNRPLEDIRPLLEEDQLIAVVFGVLRLQKFDYLDSFREEVNSAIKATVKQAVAESVSLVEVDLETTSVAEQAKALPIQSWLALIIIITSRLRIIINRVKVMIGVMVQAVEAITGRAQPSMEGVQSASIVTMSNDSNDEPLLGEAACVKALAGLKDTLCWTCDFAHDRCAKLLHARSRDQALDKMTAKEFLSLSHIIETFVTETENVCGRKSVSFRSELQGQATRFVARFREERNVRLKYNLTSERWKAVRAPDDMQKLLDHISQSGTLSFPPESKYDGDSSYEEEKTPSSKSISHSSLPSLQNDVHTNSSATATDVPSAKSSSSSSSSAAHSIGSVALSNGGAAEGLLPYATGGGGGGGGVTAEGEEYVIVGVCVVVIRIVVEYAECSSTLRLAAQQLLTGLMDLLRRFNADTCRLLVEAGAVSFGLKTITTRHLGLAWRSLQLLLTFMPKLRKHFSALLKPSIADKYIDQLIKEYEEHCDAIQKKVVGVVSDSLDKQLKVWGARSPVPSNSFAGILKSLTKLHETVSGVLPPKQIRLLFEEVTKALQQKLQFHLARLSVSSVGPQSWVVTSELTFYFNHATSLGVKLSISQEDFLLQLWKQPQPPPPPPQKQS